MHRWMDRIFARYGTAAEIRSDLGSRLVKVFFHSVKSKAWQNMQRQFSPLGEVPRGQYVCMLPASAAVAVEDTLAVDGKCYQVQRLEAVTVAGRTVCLWSLCTEKGSEDSWGLNA